MKSNQQHFLLGLFFVVVLGLLGYFTLFMSEVPWMSDRQYISVFFPEAHGLRKGDAVLVAGVRWGRVEELTFDPTAEQNRRIVVVASLDEVVQLREGHQIVIADATLLGGRNLEIDPGPPTGAPTDMQGELFGSVGFNAFDAIGELVRDNSGTVEETLTSLRNLVTGVEEGHGVLGPLFTDDSLGQSLRDGVASAQSSFDNIDVITGDLREGKGTLGRLLSEDSVYVELEKISVDLSALLADGRQVIADVRNGEGTVSRVIYDKELATDVADAVENLRSITDSINKGEGTIGKLVNDPTLYDDLSETVARVARGEGTLGKLFTEEAVYEDLSRISADVADIVRTIREGRGTVGRLVMEEKVYDELLKAVGLLTRSLEEYREAAPIGTFTSVIFGAF
jgi:phospholipid/cholesterol/gamma-HCH transport system substrate-binding protein